MGEGSIGGISDHVGDKGKAVSCTSAKREVRGSGEEIGPFQYLPSRSVCVNTECESTFLIVHYCQEGLGVLAIE